MTQDAAWRAANAIPKFVELEIAKAVKPLEERIEQLENQLRDLQLAKKPGLIKRLLGQED